MTLTGPAPIVDTVNGMARPRAVVRAVRRRLPDPLARVLGTITRVETEAPAVALTFDDGPDPASTPRLLELLARHGAKATFFMLGVQAAARPDVVRQVVAAGHALGNHSWDHPSFPTIPARERRRQIRRCDEALAPHATRLFRPPFGHQSIGSRVDLLVLRRIVVTWDLAAVDWFDHPPSWMADRVVRGVRAGSIVLFHDYLFRVFDERYRARDAMLAAVAAVLERLRETFRFVTVPELLRLGRPRRVGWWRRDPAALAALTPAGTPASAAAR